MKLDFVKLHGLGNDFVFVDDFDEQISLTPEQVAHMCDRHFGVGADGVVLVRPSKRPECAGYMHYINSDGTLAEMCGNGIRCFTKFLVDNGRLNDESNAYVADTLRGPLPISYEVDEQGLMTCATVDMDEPILDPALVPVDLPANGRTNADVPFVKEETVPSPWGDFAFTCVSMGNPHAVCFLDDVPSLPSEWFVASEKSLATFDLDRIGAFFESNPVFPAKSNIEFIVADGDGLHMRVFERGCGETLACGTGACASLVAAVLTGRSGRTNTVHLRGGDLEITWADDNHVKMTGPAAQSFTGSIEL